MLQGSHIRARPPVQKEMDNKNIGGGARGQTNEGGHGVTDESDDDIKGEKYLTPEQRAYLMKQKV